MFKQRKTTYKRGGRLKGVDYDVGKIIGGKIYMHLDYAQQLPNQDEFRKALSIAKTQALMKAPMCVCYNPQEGLYTFTDPIDFNLAREPRVGFYCCTDPGCDGLMGAIRAANYSNTIWHHKWMWVDERYDGFDVDAAEEWSKLWTAHIPRPDSRGPQFRKQLGEVFGYE